MSFARRGSITLLSTIMPTTRSAEPSRCGFSGMLCSRLSTAGIDGYCGASLTNSSTSKNAIHLVRLPYVRTAWYTTATCCGNGSLLTQRPSCHQRSISSSLIFRFASHSLLGICTVSGSLPRLVTGVSVTRPSATYGATVGASASVEPSS